MVEYNWEVLSLYSSIRENELDDIVKRITYKVTAKDGNVAVDFYNDITLPFPDHNYFIPFKDLTNLEVINWIKQLVDIPQLEIGLLKALENAKDPSRVVHKAIPWNYESKYSNDSRYIIVHNEEVVYGPDHWNSERFNNKLSELEINYSFPFDIVAFRQGLIPLDKPTVLNENTSVYRAEILNEQEHENMFTRNGETIWDFTSGVAIGTCVAADKDLAEIRKSLYQIIEQNRNNKEMAGLTVEIREKEFKILTGPVSRLNLLEKYNLMNENDTCIWKFMENKWAVLNKEEVMKLYDNIMDYIRNLNQWEYDKTLEIMSAESANQLKAINLEINL
jgi:hypothetical protein